MSRVTSQYPALTGGMSQRPERALRANQLRAQLNMIYDPVMGGLTRRPGTEYVDEVAALSAYAGDTHRGYQTVIDGVALSVHYKAKASGTSGAVLVLNETTGDLVEATPKGGDTLADSVRASGVNAIVTIGDLLVMAPAAQTPLYSTTYPWAVESNQRHHLVWVRGGAYSRSFRMTLIKGNRKCTVEYTTLEATYPKILDTSDLLPTDPDYSKKVNDRTNAYNSEATAWIAAAIEDIAPENIANKLARGLEQSGFLSTGSTVTVDGSTLFINDPEVEEVEAGDAGDGNLIRAVGNVVGAPELLSTQAVPGKIVKVRPGNSERGEVFYLKARAKDGSTNTSAVTWEEAAGEETTPYQMFVYMAKRSAGGYAYSSDLDWVNTESGRSFRGPQISVSGDLLSNPPPDFFGSVVTAMALFQDRLMVCKSDGYVAFSRVGDYFNFFRQSAVTVSDSDPVAFYITAAVGDTVRNTLPYNSNLMLAGDQRQYVLPASQALSPSRNGAGPFSAVAGMNTSPPRLVGDSVFFSRVNNGYGSLHALRPGRVVESPNEVEVTAEVNTLVDGAVVDVAASSTPSLVFARTAARLFVVDYAHAEGAERYAVHEWDFPLAGTLVSFSVRDGTLYLLFYRDNLIVAERIRLQRTAPGATQPPAGDLWVDSDTYRAFTSRVTPVSPRLSPEAGNITGTGLGSGGYMQQRMTVATMIPFFAATSGVRVKVTGQPDREFFAKE
jgi:hypothetical protein